jgi:hypothetical protein
MKRIIKINVLPIKKENQNVGATAIIDENPLRQARDRFKRRSDAFNEKSKNILDQRSEDLSGGGGGESSVRPGGKNIEAHIRIRKAINLMRWSMLEELPKSSNIEDPDERNKWMADLSRQILLIIRQWMLACGRPPSSYEAFQLALEKLIDGHMLHSYWGNVSQNITIPSLADLTQQAIDLDKMLISEFMELDPQAESRAVDEGESVGQSVALMLILKAQAKDALVYRASQEKNCSDILSEPLEKHQQWAATAPKEVFKNGGFSVDDENDDTGSVPVDVPVGAPVKATDNPQYSKVGVMTVPRTNEDLAVTAWDFANEFYDFFLSDDGENLLKNPEFEEWVSSIISDTAIKHSGITKKMAEAKLRKLFTFHDVEAFVLFIDGIAKEVRKYKERVTGGKSTRWDSYLKLFFDYVRAWAFDYADQTSRPTILFNPSGQDRRQAVAPMPQLAHSESGSRRETSSSSSSSRSRTPTRRGSPASERGRYTPAAAAAVGRDEVTRIVAREEPDPQIMQQAWPVTPDEESKAYRTSFKNMMSVFDFFSSNNKGESSVEKLKRTTTRESMMAALMRTALAAATGVGGICGLFWATSINSNQEFMLGNSTDALGKLIAEIELIKGKDFVKELKDLGNQKGLASIGELVQEMKKLEAIISMEEIDNARSKVEQMNSNIPELMKFISATRGDINEWVTALPPEFQEKATEFVRRIDHVTETISGFDTLNKQALSSFQSFSERLAVAKSAIRKLVVQGETVYKDNLLERLNGIIASAVEDSNLRTRLQKVIDIHIDQIFASAQSQISPIDALIERLFGNGRTAGVFKAIGAQSFLYRYLAPMHAAQMTRVQTQLKRAEELLVAMAEKSTIEIRNPAGKLLSQTDTFAIGSQRIDGAKFVLSINGNEKTYDVQVDARELINSIPPSEDALRSSNYFYNAVFYTVSLISGTVRDALSVFQATNKNVPITQVDIKNVVFTHTESNIDVTRQIQSLRDATHFYKDRFFSQSYGHTVPPSVVSMVSDPSYNPVSGDSTVIHVTAHLLSNRLRSFLTSLKLLAWDRNNPLLTELEASSNAMQKMLRLSNKILGNIVGEVDSHLREVDILDKLMVDYVQKMGNAARHSLIRNVFERDPAPAYPSDFAWRLRKAIQIEEYRRTSEAAESITMCRMKKISKFFNKWSSSVGNRINMTFSDMLRLMGTLSTIGGCTYFLYQASTIDSTEFAGINVGPTAVATALITSVGIPLGDYGMAKVANFITYRSSSKDTTSSSVFKTALARLIATPESPGPWGKVRFMLNRLGALLEKQTNPLSASSLGLSLMINHPTVSATVMSSMVLGLTAAFFSEFALLMRSMFSPGGKSRPGDDGGDYGRGRRPVVVAAARNPMEVVSVFFGGIAKVFRCVSWILSCVGWTFSIGQFFGTRSVTSQVSKMAINAGISRGIAEIIGRYQDFVAMNSYLRVVGASLSLTICLGSLLNSAAKFWGTQAHREAHIDQLHAMNMLPPGRSEVVERILVEQQYLDDSADRRYEVAVFNSFTTDYPLAGAVQFVWKNIGQISALIFLLYNAYTLYHSVWGGVGDPVDAQAFLENIDYFLATAAKNHRKKIGSQPRLLTHTD